MTTVFLFFIFVEMFSFNKNNCSCVCVFFKDTVFYEHYSFSEETSSGSGNNINCSKLIDYVAIQKIGLF